MKIPDKYQPRLLAESEKEGYLNWSLNFFTTTDIYQNPSIDITLQLEVTKAYKIYQLIKDENSTFFAFLLWHLVKTISKHLYFNLRLVHNQWYVIENPPITVPVALGGKDRFGEMVLEDVNRLFLVDFIRQYRTKLNQIRAGKGQRPETTIFLLSCFIGNLPNLQFTGLTLHWQKSLIEGQPQFYFGKRYWQNDKLFIPFAIKLHHAVTDPFMLDLLIQDFQSQFV